MTADAPLLDRDQRVGSIFDRWGRDEHLRTGPAQRRSRHDQQHSGPCRKRDGAGTPPWRARTRFFPLVVGRHPKLHLGDGHTFVADWNVPLLNTTSVESYGFTPLRHESMYVCSLGGSADSNPLSSKHR